MKHLLFLLTIIISISCKQDIYWNLRVENIANGEVIVKLDDVILEKPYLILENSEVTVSTVADEGFFFNQWGGDLVSLNETEKFVMNGDKVISASFSSKPSLKLLGCENGTIIVKNGDTILEEPYMVDIGTILTLEAVPVEKYGFKEWTNDVNGTESIVEVKISENKTVGALFKRTELIVKTSGEGEVIVRDQEKILEPPYYLGYGEKVYVEAKAAKGSYLRFWKGDIGGSSKVVAITMSRDLNIECEFELEIVRDVRHYLVAEANIKGDKKPVMKNILEPSEIDTFNIGHTFPNSLSGIKNPVSANVMERSIGSFAISRYETTYWLWWTVKCWAENNGYSFKNSGAEGILKNGKNFSNPTTNKFHPVTGVSWIDAIVWINALNEMLKLSLVYFSDEDLLIPIKVVPKEQVDSSIKLGSIQNPYVNWNSLSYRLPTEAEWEYCAKKKVNGFNYGTFASGASEDSEAGRVNVAWYMDSVTLEVGSRSANYFEIYDMSGNVAEWCWDWHENYYSEGTNLGPSVGEEKIIRGGSYLSSRDDIVISRRNSGIPTFNGDMMGFRVAKTLK